MLVDGYSRVSVIEDGFERFKVKYRIDVKREDVANRHHNFLDRFVFELQRARDHFKLILLESLGQIGLFRLTHELPHFLARIRGGNFLAEEKVQNFTQRVRDDKRQHHNRVRNVPGVSADRQTMPGTNRLWYDLTKQHDEYGRSHRRKRTLQIVAQYQRRRRVDQHIAKQDRAQQYVALPSQRFDLRRVDFLLRIADFLQQVQLRQVQRHQTQIETTKQRRKTQQHEVEYTHDIQWEQIFGRYELRE